MKRTCLVLANATRARIFTYQRVLEPAGLRDELHEDLDLVDLERHHAAGDQHEHLDAEFARSIITQLTRIVREHAHHEVHVIASPHMLGELRARLDGLRHAGVAITELQRDYTLLPVEELRAHLAQHAILPSRAPLPAGLR